MECRGLEYYLCCAAITQDCGGSASMIGVQLHISLSQALVDQIASVENDEMSFRKKPKYGFWTSSWREETQDSSWVEWCSGENYGDPYSQQWFLLTPKA